MAEYIVDVGNADAEHVKMFGIQATHLFGHPVGEEIVRCRDCEHGHKAHYRGRTIIDCHGPLVQTWDYWQDEPLVNEVRPDGFCAWGVRRDDA